MSIKYGRIDYSETGFTEQIFHKGQNLNSSSLGVNYVLTKKDDFIDQDRNVRLSESGSHWAFIHTLFYMSGSSKVASEQSGDIHKFNDIFQAGPYFNSYKDLNPIFQNKFYETASVFYIPQQYFGEKIQTGSFQLTARTGSSGNTTKQIIIKDDGNGNLYSTNAEHSQSAGALSSKDNYVGNIFYEQGIAVLTETASWSGSVDYTDFGRRYVTDSSEEKDYRFWNVSFNSTTPIFTTQYSIKIPAGDFNRTMNDSVRGDFTGSDASERANIRTELTGSGWSPYFNQIQLFRNNDGEEPLLIANLPRNVKMRDDVDIIVTFRVDH
tara:strand:- start:627 stop:1598 length:972 start_codon:yes stop_codon:yes gene_type:complete